MAVITTTMPLPPLALDRVPGDPTFTIGMLSHELTALLGRDGRLHGCVVCLGSTMHHWSPAALADDPRAPGQWRDVEDCGLHPRCVPGLITEWAMIIHEVDGPVDTAAPVMWRRGQGAHRVGAYGRRRRD